MKTTMDQGKAITTLKKCARAGDGDAAARLGDIYRDGCDVAQSWEEAFRWYSIGARAGDAEAQNNLGTLYLEGLYVAEDFNAAAHWYRLSAEQGASVAQYNLGMRYLHGQGVPTDFAEARCWLERAAEQGYVLANTEIGIMCLVGEGCTPDRKLARDHLITAALNGDERAFEHLDPMIFEIEEAVLAGDMDLMRQFPWLYRKGLGGTDCLMKAWAWMRWLEIQSPLPGGMGCKVLMEVDEMEQNFKQQISADEARRGVELFEAIKRENPIPRYPTIEELIGDMEDCENDDERRWRELCINGLISVDAFRRGIALSKAIEQGNKVIEQIGLRFNNNSASEEVIGTVTDDATIPSWKQHRLERWRQACDMDAQDESGRTKKKRGLTVIVDLGAEGGGFTLFGKKKAGTWTFWCELSDWTPTLEDEPAIHRRSDEATSWDAAVALLDKHCNHWIDLYPTEIHPEFRARVWELVGRRYLIQKQVGNREVEQ